MFVYDFVQLDTPFDEVKQRLLHGGGAWLGPLATAAYHGGEATALALGLEAEPLPVQKHVVVELDSAVESDGVVVLPIRWRATGPSRLFPALDGHLEVSRLGPGRTHVSLLGNYEPPGGYFGRLADRMGLHHLAEAGVRSFLRRVAERLDETGQRLASEQLHLDVVSGEVR